jgi:hypothetical protein
MERQGKSLEPVGKALPGNQDVKGCGNRRSAFRQGQRASGALQPANLTVAVAVIPVISLVVAQVESGGSGANQLLQCPQKQTLLMQRSWQFDMAESEDELHNDRKQGQPVAEAPMLLA